MIDFTMEDLMELARQADLQKRVEAGGVKAPEPKPVVLPDFCVIETLRSVLDDEGFEIPAGAQGTVLGPVANGQRYLVEFTDEPYQQRCPGGRLGLATLPPSVMRVVWVPGDPVNVPEDLRGKLGEEKEAKGNDPPSDPR